jgi:hypothetical protein
VVGQGFVSAKKERPTWVWTAEEVWLLVSLSAPALVLVPLLCGTQPETGTLRAAISSANICTVAQAGRLLEMEALLSKSPRPCTCNHGHSGLASCRNPLSLAELPAAIRFPIGPGCARNSGGGEGLPLPFWTPYHFSTAARAQARVRRSAPHWGHCTNG